MRRHGYPFLSVGINEGFMLPWQYLIESPAKTCRCFNSGFQDSETLV